MMQTSKAADDFSVAYYSGDRSTGAIAMVDHRNGALTVTGIECAPQSDAPKPLKPVFIGLTEDRHVILLDPKAKTLAMEPCFPADAFAAHIYRDPYSSRAWFMNDGDKETGNDTLNCGDQGSSVTVVDNAESSAAKFLATVCVGRGHHQAAFTAPSASAPQVPHRAYISNLKDGTLSVIGNDPKDSETYLKRIDTINLCEPEKEEEGAATVPNNAFPHGLAYSPLSGKLYNLNNGYGTVAIIDPVTNVIEDRHDFKGHSNLFISPDGRYVIGRGADRKSDPKHVIAKLTVLDVSKRTITDQMALPDIYISKYFFNSDGSKLYLTVGSSGSPEQQANLKTDVILVFDMSALPKLKLSKEITVGAVGTMDFLDRGPGERLAFCSNAQDGQVVVIDGEHDTVLDRIDVAPRSSHSRLWVLDR